MLASPHQAPFADDAAASVDLANRREHDDCKAAEATEIEAPAAVRYICVYCSNPPPPRGSSPGFSLRAPPQGDWTTNPLMNERKPESKFDSSKAVSKVGGANWFGALSGAEGGAGGDGGKACGEASDGSDSPPATLAVVGKVTWRRNSNARRLVCSTACSASYSAWPPSLAVSVAGGAALVASSTTVLFITAALLVAAVCSWRLVGMAGGRDDKGSSRSASLEPAERRSRHRTPSQIHHQQFNSHSCLVLLCAFDMLAPCEAQFSTRAFVQRGYPGTDGRHHASRYAFAALKADGSVTAWGYSSYGGSGAPTDTGYTAIYSAGRAFAALKADGSVTAWGDSSYGGSGAPTDTGYIAIYSAERAFAALKADGSVTAWGSYGGSGAPTDTGYTAIYSTAGAFAAVKADGAVTAWSSSDHGGSGAPTDTGYTALYSTWYAFAAVKADGSVTAWGYSSYGGSGAPTDTGYTALYSTGYAFAAVKADGAVTAWGRSSDGGSGAPTDTGYTAIYSAERAFAALKADGAVTASVGRLFVRRQRRADRHRLRTF